MTVGRLSGVASSKTHPAERKSAFSRPMFSKWSSPFKEACVMTEHPASCGMSRLAGSGERPQRKSCCLSAIQKKKREKKRKEKSGACKDFRNSSGPPPCYITLTACVTGRLTSVSPGRASGGHQTENRCRRAHSPNPPGTLLTPDGSVCAFALSAAIGSAF